MSFGHLYHARFSPTKATFASTSSPSRSGVPSHRTISEADTPPPSFWRREQHQQRSASSPSASPSRPPRPYAYEAREPTSAQDGRESSWAAPTVPSSLGQPSSSHLEPSGLLPSPMLSPASGSGSFDPFSSVHNLPASSDEEPGLVRRGSRTPSYMSTASSASSFTCSPYPPPPSQQRQQQDQRPPSMRMAFVFPSHPPPPPPAFATNQTGAPSYPSTKSNSHGSTGTAPPPTTIEYSPFFRDEDTDEDVTSYYFTSQSETSSFETPFVPEDDSYAAERPDSYATERPSSTATTYNPSQTTPTASPVTPRFPPRQDSQRSEQEKYKDDLRNYTRGLLRGVHRAASEPAEEVGMGAWTKAGGIQEDDVDMENRDGMETLMGGSLGRRVRRKGRNASEGGRGFREVAVCE